MTHSQLCHLLLLFQALYITEGWTNVVASGCGRANYARARSVVIFDRIITGRLEITP